MKSALGPGRDSSYLVAHDEVGEAGEGSNLSVAELQYHETRAPVGPPSAVED